MSLNNLFLKSGYVAAPLANGIGRYVPQCLRMTLKFCKSKGDSKGVREFIENHAVDFARRNPGTVLYLKPRRHRSPVLVAEYLNGGREWISLTAMPCEEVIRWIEVSRTAAGYGEMHFKTYQHSDTPSIQGPWNPFTHESPSKNVMQFPHEEMRDPINLKPTATDIIKKMYGDGQ